ncbi:hypothetical protein Aduo_007708 [Ancylostoma duodenale]
MSLRWTKSELLMNGTIAVSLYRSRRSKLVVAVGDVPGPMVKGCISFATEADSEEGLPHTVEHLVFSGSKKYPFTGFLTMVASRCLASKINAYTDQDRTGFILNTVGSEGFLKALPVFLDNILSPVLSNSHFATEIHHINGKGEDAGVVYCETQGHESEMSRIIDRKTKEIMYPPNNPYRVDVGGRPKNLRETCSLDRIRDFHKKYYHLSNMFIVVCGRVDHKRLLEIAEAAEEEHLHIVPASFRRPFSSCQLVLPPESSVHHVACPSDDECSGMVVISWLACEATNYEERVAFDVLFAYLSCSPVSPLQQKFVFIDTPLASEVGIYICEQITCLMQLMFRGVPTKRLNDVEAKCMDEVIKEHLLDNTWDMKRIGDLITKIAKAELKKVKEG